MKSLLQLAVVTAILVAAYSRSLGKDVQGGTDSIHEKAWPYIDAQEIVDKEVGEWKRIISASTNPSSLPFALPHINRIDFIKRILQSVSNPFFKSVQIVVAPKSAGKSTGLRLVHNALVRHPKYLPVTLMLSIVSNTSLPDCIRPFTAAIDREYKELSKAERACVWSAYTHTCTVVRPEPLYEWLLSHSWLNVIGGALASLAAAMCTWKLAVQLAAQLAVQLYRAIIDYKIIAAVVVGIVAVIFFGGFCYIIETTVPSDDTHTFLNTSSWFYPMCLLQSIGNCTNVRPVLFLMELPKVSVSCQADIMDLMKGVKFTGTPYPVIIETSDFAWIYSNVMHKRPIESFKLVTFPELSRNELYEALNVTYSLLTTEEVDVVYERFQGHVGLWQTVWTFLAEEQLATLEQRRLTLHEAVDFVDSLMRAKLRRALDECTFSNITSLCEQILLQILKGPEDIERSLDNLRSIKVLVEHDILYYDVKSVLRPQNYAVTRMISEEIDAEKYAEP